MSTDPTREERLDVLAHRLRTAQVVTSDLMSSVIAGACTRLPMLNTTGEAFTRFAGLVQCRAWTDAMLALIEIELPGWSLRRLAHDDGAWLCSLSRQPNMPVELDDTADAHHRVMPLAIANAFIEARRRAVSQQPARSSATPRVSPISGHVVCCDNFT
jgi:hypothetical protein